MKLPNFIISCIISASCLIALPTAMASSKATKANASPNQIKESPNKIGEYLFGPASCPGHCASGANFGGILAAENVQECDPEDKNQRWLIHQEHDGGEIIKIESPVIAGRCLGVAAHNGDDMLGIYAPVSTSLQTSGAMEGGLFYEGGLYGVGQPDQQEPLSLSEQQLVSPGPIHRGTLLLFSQGQIEPYTVIVIIAAEDGKTVKVDQLEKVLNVAGPGRAALAKGLDLSPFVANGSFRSGLSLGFVLAVEQEEAEMIRLQNEIEEAAAVRATVFSMGKHSEEKEGRYFLKKYDDADVITPTEGLDGLAIPSATFSYFAQPLGGAWGVLAIGLFDDPERTGKLEGTFLYRTTMKTYSGAESFFAPPANADTCTGQLALVDCQDPTASWLFSGAQLFSATCWIQGHSAAMTVNEDCTSLELSLAANGAPNPITRAQSFMLFEPSFVETMVPVQPADGGGSDSSGGDLGSVYPYTSTEYDAASDRRLKHQITLIDKSPSGIPIYSFQYRDGIKLADNKELDTKSTFVGVMAQDLLELAPHAVSKNKEDGYYRVDYSKIDVDFGKL